MAISIIQCVVVGPKYEDVRQGFLWQPSYMVKVEQDGGSGRSSDFPGNSLGFTRQGNLTLRKLFVYHKDVFGSTNPHGLGLLKQIMYN